MSVLADLYLSREDDVVRYDAAPEQFADRAQYQSITPLELSMLWAASRRRDWPTRLPVELHVTRLEPA
jgi:hypothetical protein